MMAPHQGGGRFIGLVLLAVGCVSSSPEETEKIPFPPEYSTGQLRIATDFDAPLCAGNVALMDAQLRWLQQELDGARDEPTGIYLYAGEGPIGALAEGGLVAGYWDRPVVYAVWDAVSHELVHAAMSGVNEHVLTVLQEGFAVALSGSPQLQEENSREALGPALLEPFHHGIGSSGAYQSAGHFARWMFAEYGAQASVELYAGTAPGMTEDELSELWMDVVGVSLAEALTPTRRAGRTSTRASGPWRADRARASRGMVTSSRGRARCRARTASPTLDITTTARSDSTVGGGSRSPPTASTSLRRM